jgi:DNA-binding beta-propeller fold protein YncE
VVARVRKAMSARDGFGLALAALFLLGGGPPPTQPVRAADPAPISLEPVRLVYRQAEGRFLRGPQGVFVDRLRGEVYVADTLNDLVVVYDLDGVPRFAFGYNGEFKEPVKAVTDRAGRIYVLAGVDRALKVFSYRGEFIRDFGFPGAGGRVVPAALGGGDDGKVYVADAATGRVLVYDNGERLTLSLGGDDARDSPAAGQTPRLQAPQAIAVDRDGAIYVADARAMPIQVFARDGRFLRGWGEREAGPHNFSLPSGLALDGDGRVIVVDTLRQAISVFTTEGAFLGRHGGLGTRAGAVAFPSDIASDGNGRLYVVERVGNRLQILEQRASGPSGRAPSAAPGRVREALRRSMRDLGKEPALRPAPPPPPR